MQDRERMVRIRAYQIWESLGKPEGQHEAHWKQALKELGLLDPTEQPDNTIVEEPQPDSTP